MPFSDNYANKILSAMFGKTQFSISHAKVYIGLCSNDPEADSGTFTELSGGGYERVCVAIYGAAFPDLFGTVANRKIKNKAQINWTKATANWATANGFGLFTSETGGDPFYYGKLKNPVTCGSGEVALFDPESLQVAISASDEEIA